MRKCRVSSGLARPSPCLLPSYQAVIYQVINQSITYIERLGVGKLQAALVPAADELAGRIHGVTKRRRHLRVGRGTAGIVAGAGAAIGAGGGRGISW